MGKVPESLTTGLLGLRGPLVHAGNASRNSRSAASAVSEATHHTHACCTEDGCSHEPMHDLHSVEVWDDTSMQLRAPVVQDDAWRSAAMREPHELENHKKFDAGCGGDDYAAPQHSSAASMLSA